MKENIFLSKMKLSFFCAANALEKQFAQIIPEWSNSLSETESARNHGICMHHLRLDLCFDKGFHDSLQADLIEGVDLFKG